MLKILSYNLCNESDYTSNFIESLKYCEKNCVDLICYQEFDPKLFTIENNIKKKYKYTYECFYNSTTPKKISCFQNVIFSKRKLHTSKRNNCVYITIKKKRVYIFNVHLNDSPYQPYQEKNIDYGDGFPSTDKKDELMCFSKMARGDAIDVIFNTITSKLQKYDCIVCGDFNEPPGYYVSNKFLTNKNFRLMNKGMPTQHNRLKKINKNYYYECHEIDLFYVYSLNFGNLKESNIEIIDGFYSDHDMVVLSLFL